MCNCVFRRGEEIPEDTAEETGVGAPPFRWILGCSWLTTHGSSFRISRTRTLEASHAVGVIFNQSRLRTVTSDRAVHNDISLIELVGVMSLNGNYQEAILIYYLLQIRLHFVFSAVKKFLNVRWEAFFFFC